MSERPRALLGIAGVAALVALVAVASRGNAPRLGEDAPAGRPPALLTDYLATVALLMVPLGAVIVVWIALQRRVAPGRNVKRRGSPLVSIAAFALLVGFAFWAVRHFERPPGLRTPTVPTTTVTTGAGKNKKQPSPPRKAEFRWLPVFVLGSIALGFAVTFAFAAVRRRNSLASPLSPQLLAEVLEESLDDLRGEPDPRRAVIRTYARMERTFGAHGLPRRPFEAPLEYLERVLARVEASAHSVRRLTQLFERARFSEHVVDPQMKDEAIEALAALRVELAART